MNTLEAALQYAARGWHVFPIDPVSRVPLKGSRGHHDATTNEQTVRGWWGWEGSTRSYGIGLALRLSGLIALDVEGPAKKVSGMPWLEVHDHELHQTWHQCTPSGGIHALFQCPEPELAIRAIRCFEGVDVLGDGYVALAPTPGYEPFAQQEIVAKLPRILEEALRNHRVKPRGSSRPLSTDGEAASPDLLAWVRGLLFQRRAVEGEGGDNATFAACALLVNDAALSEEQAWGLLKAWNQTNCLPPWDEAELRAKLANGGKYATTGYGSLRQTYALERAVTAVATPDRPTFDGFGMDVAEFLNTVGDSEDEQPYWIEGLVPAEVPMVIAGHPKARKSWVMYLLALLIARGEDWGGLKVNRGKVLIVGREDSARETARRLWRLARGLGFDPRELAGWLRVEVQQAVRLDDHAQVAALREAVRGLESDVVFIDCLSRVHVQDENSRTDMAVVTNAWADLAKDAGCTVAIVHHMSKHGKGPLLHRMRGSGDLGAVVRFGVGTAVETQDSIMVETDGNLQGMAPPFYLRFEDIETEGGKKIIEVKRVTKADLFAEENEESRKNFRISVYRAVEEGCTTNVQLREKLRCDRTRLSKVVAEMVAEGTLMRAKKQLTIRRVLSAENWSDQ